MWDTACLISPANPDVGFTLLQTRIDLWRITRRDPPVCGASLAKAIDLKIAVECILGWHRWEARRTDPTSGITLMSAEEKASLWVQRPWSSLSWRGDSEIRLAGEVQIDVMRRKS